MDIIQIYPNPSKHAGRQTEKLKGYRHKSFKVTDIPLKKTNITVVTQEQLVAVYGFKDDYTKTTTKQEGSSTIQFDQSLIQFPSPEVTESLQGMCKSEITEGNNMINNSNH